MKIAVLFLTGAMLAPAASLSGSLSTSVTSANLTTEGTADWEHWGYAGSISPDRKNGTPLLSNYTVIGGGTPAVFTNSAIAYTWTDGASPNTSVAGSTTGIFITGAGKGFTLTAPADTSAQTVKVYLGVFRSTLSITAHLSDSSAADYTDSSFVNTTGIASAGVYTLTYSAASAGQTLTISFTSSLGAPGNVNLQAVALAGILSPDFSIAVSPSSQGVLPGHNTTYTVTVAPLNGYTGTISFSTSGLPGSITPGFSPATVTTSGSTTLTVTASGVAPPGTYPFTITGTDGTLTHSTSASILVADFTIGVSPPTQGVPAGTAATYTVTITANGGYAGTVSFSVTGLPGAITSGFSPTTVTGSGSSTLTLTTSGGTASGSYSFSVTATDGTITHSASANLSVVTIYIGSHNACLGAAGTATVTCTLTGVQAGSTIVAHTITDNSVSINGVVDNQGTPCTYTEFQIGAIDWNFQINRERAWYCQAVSGGTITLTMTAAGTAAAKFLFAAELIGAKRFKAVLDKSSSAVQAGCALNCVIPTAVTTSQSDELIIAAGCPNGTTTPFASAGYTLLANLSSPNISCGQVYTIVSAISTYTAQINFVGTFPTAGALMGTFIAQPTSAATRKVTSPL